MAQIGTIRLETQNSGTVSVPVFDIGDSGSDVYEFLRVQTASGAGFIPLVDPSSATFPYIRVQSQNNGVVALHNEVALQIGDLTSSGSKDGFEDGNYTSNPSWNETGATKWAASTTKSRNGSWSVREDESAGIGTLNISVGNGITDGVIISAWMNIDNAANDTYYGITPQQVSDHYSSNPRGCWITCNNGDNYRVSTEDVTDGGINVSNDGSSWYGFELEFDTNSDNVIVRAYDDTVTQIDSATVNAGYTISNESHYISFGGRTNRQSVFNYFDNVTYTTS